MGNRILWIDNLKAIAIFFVVIGHTVGLPETVGPFRVEFRSLGMQCYGLCLPDARS